MLNYIELRSFKATILKLKNNRLAGMRLRITLPPMLYCGVGKILLLNLRSIKISLNGKSAAQSMDQKLLHLHLCKIHLEVPALRHQLLLHRLNNHHLRFLPLNDSFRLHPPPRYL